MAQGAASGVDEEKLRAELDRGWDAVDAGAPWFSRRERQRVHAMLDTFLTWLKTSRQELRQVAVEHDVTVELPPAEDTPKVRLRGRIDRLEADADGHPVVVDIKTGKTPISADDAKEHPQLAMYQLAAAYGAFTRLGLDSQPAGARLLYVSKRHRSTGAAERTQDPLDEDTTGHWLGVVHQAAASSTGPTYTARENPDCPRCPVRTTCPIHPSGRQVP
jgi:RecB family exonuclease